MPVELFTAAERRGLSRFPPEVDASDLKAFWLDDSDLSEVVSWRRDDPGCLAAGLQIGALRLFGFVPDDLSSAPSEVVNAVAAQLSVEPTSVAGYAPPGRTLRRHVERVVDHVGFRRADRAELKAVADWLVERALEHDRPTVLFELCSDFLRRRRIVRPGVSTMERIVASARQAAEAETWLRISSRLSATERVLLDSILEVDSVVGLTRLAWLCRQAPAALPELVRDQLDKLVFIRGLGSFDVCVERLPAARVRHLAEFGRRVSAQALRRYDPARRYQILVCVLVDLELSLADEVLDLFDTALGDLDRRARNLVERERVRLAKASRPVLSQFASVGRLVLDEAIPDGELRHRILETVDGPGLAASLEITDALLVPDEVKVMNGLRSRYGRPRRYSPAVLAAFDFESTPGLEVLDAVSVLVGLNESGSRRVPDDAPTGFVPKRWLNHLRDDHGRIDRRLWELAVLYELRARLRSGDVWVARSRRHLDPQRYLLDDSAYDRYRQDDAELFHTSATERLASLDAQLNASIEALDQTLTEGTGARIEDGRLVVTPLAADEPDPSSVETTAQVVGCLPAIELVDLLVEVDQWTGFLSAFTHAANAGTRDRDHVARLLAVLIANGCNLGTTDMARSCEFTAAQLQWTQTWYLRTDTVTAANTMLVNHHHTQPGSVAWGTGVLSSSDGQRFPFSVRNPTGTALRRYFKRTGATIYTWTADHHIQYGTRVIPSTVREATHVLDAILDNPTDVDIEEHTTDTAGYTDLVFGLFDLCGLRFSPRIRDLADQRLWRLPGTITGTPASKLVRHNVATGRIIAQWDQMNLVAASIRSGHTPASQLIARLQASARQNEVTRAIQEHGRILKTISILDYLADENRRRRIHHQLNKGESIHALKRRLFYANLGHLTRRRSDEQHVQALCLTLLANAIICWNTTYLTAAAEHIDVDRSALTATAPTLSAHVNIHGRYNLTSTDQPEPGSLRPLRLIS